MKDKKSITINVLLNIIRQICTIIFPLITLPYASRVLQDKNYGKINFASSVISYYSIIAALGISTYAVREGASKRENRKCISEFSSQIFSINMCSTVASYVLLLVSLFVSEKLQNYEVLLCIYSVGIILTTLGVEWIYALFEDYLLITIRTIIIQIVSLVLMVTFVRTPDDFYIYALVNVIANGGVNIWGLIYSKKYVDLKITFHMKMRQHMIPLIIMLGNALAMVVYVNSDITLLGFILNDKYVGIYSVAVKIYTGVKQLLNAILVVALPRIALYLNNGLKKKYNDFASRVFLALLVFLMPIMTGLFCLSKNVVILISGQSYQSGATALRILSLALIFSIGAGFYSYAILITNKCEAYVLKSTIIAAVMNVLLNIIFIKMFKQNGAALTTLIAEAIVCLLCAYYSKPYCDIKIKKTDIESVLLGTICVFVTCMLFVQYAKSAWGCIIGSVIISIFIYAIILFVFHNSILVYFFQKIKKNERI